MRVYVILGFSLMFLFLGLDWYVSDWWAYISPDGWGYISILFDLLGEYTPVFLAPILLIFSILGFFYLWKNNAFKKK